MASLDDYQNSCEDQKEVYYLRLHRLVVKHGTHVLRSKFDQFIPPDELHAVLQNRKFVGNITHALQKNYINLKQKAQLYPPSGPPSSKDFDISLLFYLLRNVCGLDTKSKWWKCEENSKIPGHNDGVIEDIVRIRNLRNKLHHASVASLEKDEFESDWDLAEKVMVRLTEQCGITDYKDEIDKEKSSRLDLVSEELRSIRANTAIFLEDFEDESLYVETKAYERALRRLKEKNIVVLTGHPGEGKTTMAARLALSTTETRNCLLLKEPADWRRIDLSLKIIKTVIIDDIFGAGSLDEKMVGHWRNFLSEIDRAAEKKIIKVIITSRHYIFKESKEELGAIPIFGTDETEDNPVILLESMQLLEEEKIKILQSQAKRNKRDVPYELIKECVAASAGPTVESQNILFGFPECVSMFVRNNRLFDTGAGFFKKPAALFKNYLKDLYKMRPTESENKFLALVLVWSKENKILSSKEFQRVKTASEHVKIVADIFDREVDRDFLDTIQQSLTSHVGGFLVYNDRLEQYAFSHNIIGDMVGLVIADKRTDQAIEICPRDFLMEFVSIDEQDEFKIKLKESQYQCLAKKMTKMMVRDNCNEVPLSFRSEFLSLMRTGARKNDIDVYSRLDFGLIKHNAFTKKKFLDEFINHIVEHNYIEKIFETSVMSMTGFFLDYGIRMDRLDMRLLDYAWFSGSRLFAMEIIQRKLLKEENINSAVSLLLAVHSRDVESVRYLLQSGTKVTGDAIYIAVHNRQEILNILLDHPNTPVNDRGNAVNGNYPLIVAARKGFTNAVNCLLLKGADPGVKNSSNMTALHKAVTYENHDIILALLEAGAPLDVKGGKFKRTPLHIAVDMDHLRIVQLLLQKNAPLLVKDHRGHYPIHIAAIQGKVEIVRALLPVDKRQETRRISSYGKLSKIKGFSLYHIGVWKEDLKLLKLLIDMKVNPNITDWYGQTALFTAVMKKNKAIVSLLLKKSDDLDKRKGQKQGFTPLHAAIYKDLTDVALELIPHSDVNAQDKFGKTALHCACEKVNERVIECLLDNRVDIRMITKRGDTIFHILRRKMRKLEGNEAYKAGLLEKYFARYDPEFVRQLPKLRNKVSVTVSILG